MKYEDRHRELREALSTAGEQYRAGTDPDDSVAVISADRRLALFQERTAPLVDELVAAVRVRRARHPNQARPARLAKCICDACENEEQALAALDEEASHA